MRNNFNLSQSQMELLLSIAGKKMGKDPDKIKQQMQNGQVNDLIAGLSPDQQAKIIGLMQNPQALQQLVANPKVQQLLKELMGGKP